MYFTWTYKRKTSERKGRKYYTRIVRFTISFLSVFYHSQYLEQIFSKDTVWQGLTSPYIFFQSMLVELLKLQNTFVQPNRCNLFLMKSHYCFALLLVSNILYFLMIFLALLVLSTVWHLFWGYFLQCRSFCIVVYLFSCCVRTSAAWKCTKVTPCTCMWWYTCM